MGYLRPQSKISSKTEPEERSERERKGSETVGHILQSSIFLPPLPEPGRNLSFLELISLKPRPQEFLTLRVVHHQAPKGLPFNLLLPHYDTRGFCSWEAVLSCDSELSVFLNMAVMIFPSTSSLMSPRKFNDFVLSTLSCCKDKSDRL